MSRKNGTHRLQFIIMNECSLFVATQENVWQLKGRLFYNQSWLRFTDFLESFSCLFFRIEWGSNNQVIELLRSVKSLGHHWFPMSDWLIDQEQESEFNSRHGSSSGFLSWCLGRISNIDSSKDSKDWFAFFFRPLVVTQERKIDFIPLLERFCSFNYNGNNVHHSLGSWETLPNVFVARIWIISQSKSCSSSSYETSFI